MRALRKLPAGRRAAGRFEFLQETQFDHLVDRGFDLVDQLGFIRAIGQKHPHQLDNLIAREHQPGIAAAGIELGQLLAQQASSKLTAKDKGGAPPDAADGERGSSAGSGRLFKKA
jgi:hypothetical protein